MELYKILAASTESLMLIKQFGSGTRAERVQWTQ